MTIHSKLIYTAILIVISILSGLWTSKAGRPLNTAIFTIHKLTALAAIVFTFMYILSFFKTQSSITGIVIFIAVAMFLLVLLVSGAMLSFDKTALDFVSRLHQIAPFLLVIVVIVIFFLYKKM